MPSEVLAVDSLVSADYTDAFEVSTAKVGAWSPEQWARSAFEGAPRVVQWFLLAGWRMLGLRLGPRSSADHVLGWAIVDRGTHSITLELRSRLLAAHVVFWVDAGRVVQSTLVRYDRRVGSVVWLPIAVIHRRVVPYLLGQAAQRAR